MDQEWHCVHFVVAFDPFPEGVDTVCRQMNNKGLIN
jgi:hypothetical protein